jgi:hypothetical protein
MNEFDERMVAAAEADLQQLLSIEPLPEFVARVRVRVHERRESPAKRWGWIGLALASAAAVILAAVLRTNQSVRVPGEQTIEMVHRADTRLGAPPAMVGDTVPSTSRGTVKMAAHYPAERGVTHAETPEIIIDPAMTEAIRRLAASLRNLPPDESVAEALQVEPGDPTALPVAKPLEIPELVLKPADQSGGN